MQPQTVEPAAQQPNQEAQKPQEQVKTAPSQILAVADRQPSVPKPEEAAKTVAEEAPDIKSQENQANWKAFRERRDLERKAKEDAENRAIEKEKEAEALKQAMEALVNRPSQGYIHDDIPPGNEESEEQRIEKKVAAAIKKERELMRQEHAQREQQEAPQRIVQMYPDFNSVVTPENCDYVDYHYPEISAPFRHMPDGIEKWSAMYKTIKRFVPNPQSGKDMGRAEKNLQKPGSISTAKTLPEGKPTDAGILTEERRAANWARMQRDRGVLGIG